MSAKINGFEQMKCFFDWIIQNQDKRPSQSHISLYMFFLNENNKRGWVEWFKCPFQSAMDGAAIGSKGTYYKTLKDLQDWKLIKYKEGKNLLQPPLISLIQLSKSGHLSEQLTEQVSEPLSEQLDEQLSGNIDKQETNNFKINIPPSAIHIKKIIEDDLDIVSINLEKWVTDYKEEIDAIGTHWINQFIVEKCKRLKKLEYQMDYDSMCRIEKKYKKEFIEQELLAMQNWKELIKKNTDVGLTLQNWLNRKGEVALNPDKVLTNAEKQALAGYTDKLFG
jgi:hypothetical protein